MGYVHSQKGFRILQGLEPHVFTHRAPKRSRFLAELPGILYYNIQKYTLPETNMLLMLQKSQGQPPEIGMFSKKPCFVKNGRFQTTNFTLNWFSSPEESSVIFTIAVGWMAAGTEVVTLYAFAILATRTIGHWGFTEKFSTRGLPRVEQKAGFF